MHVCSEVSQFTITVCKAPWMCYVRQRTLVGLHECGLCLRKHERVSLYMKRKWIIFAIAVLLCFITYASINEFPILISVMSLTSVYLI